MDLARTSMPAPSPEALAHSDRLAALIRAEIAAAGGWIGFDRYMELALYAPGLGYYDAGARKFGSGEAGGDFVTAPEISPLFARALATQVVQVFEHPLRVEYANHPVPIEHLSEKLFLRQFVDKVTQQVGQVFYDVDIYDLHRD